MSLLLLALLLPGISPDQLEAQQSVLIKTIADVAGVPNDYVSRVAPTSQQLQPASKPLQAVHAPSPAAASALRVPASPAAPAPAAAEKHAEQPPNNPLEKLAALVSAATGRRLAAAAMVVAEYAIRTDNSGAPWAAREVIRRKVLSSSANFGQTSYAGAGHGFYATLQTNGMSLRPIVYLDGARILSGELPGDAPKSRYGTRTNVESKIFAREDLVPRPASLAANVSAPPSQLRDLAPLIVPARHDEGRGGSRPQGLAAWAIGLIVAAVMLVAAATSVLVWRKFDGIRQSGRMTNIITMPNIGHIQQQFLSRKLFSRRLNNSQNNADPESDDVA